LLFFFILFLHFVQTPPPPYNINMSRLLVLVMTCALLCVYAEHTADVAASKDSFIFISGDRCPPDSCTLRNTNYGAEQSIIISSKGDTTAGLVAFSLESLRQTSSYALTKVELHLTSDAKTVNVSELGCSVNVMPLRSAEWSETTVTANNIPPADITSVMHAYIDNKGFHVPLTITPLVMSALRQKQPELGLLISAIGCNLALPSRETGSGAFIRIHTR